MRARERNVPRTRSVGCSSRGAQNPHRPHSREPSAPAAARPAPPPIEATEIRATRSRLLDVALAVVDTVERSAPCRKTADGNSLAPAELSRFLDLEVPSRASGQTTGRRGACGSRVYHGAGEPALGRATHPRGVAEARVRRLAAQRGAAYAASPDTTIADMEDVPPKPRRRPCLSRFLRRADCALPNPLRVRGPAAPSPASRALQRHGLAHYRLDSAANCRSLSRRFGARLSPPRSRQHLRWRVSPTGEGHVHRRGSLVTTLPLAEPLRRTSHRHPPPGASRPRDRPERGTSPSPFAQLPSLLPRLADASRAREGCTPAARRRATRARPRACPAPRRRPPPPLRPPSGVDPVDPSPSGGKIEAQY